MAAMEGDYDSDGAPEELTFEQGSKRDEEIREVQKENKARVAREKKERRRLWAQRKTQRQSGSKDALEVAEATTDQNDTDQNAEDTPGLLPSNVVSFLAAREKQLKQVFSSDSEKETIEDESVSRKKKLKTSGPNAVLLKYLPPPQCAQNSLDFLKKRKSQVPRSKAVLTNADQALRLLSSRGSLLSKS